MSSCVYLDAVAVVLDAMGVLHTIENCFQAVVEVVPVVGIVHVHDEMEGAVYHPAFVELALLNE